MAYSDHKPLSFSLAEVSDPRSPCQQCQLAYISEFTTNVRHIAGKDNHVADAISQAVVSAISLTELGLDFSAMAEAQRQNGEMDAYRTAITGFQLKEIFSKFHPL